MAEDLLPTIVPGMVGLRNKETKRVTNHFPVDAREILTISPGEYELVDNGAVQAARLNANPLRSLETDRSLIHSEITGVEGQVLVSMTAEEAEAWKKRSDVSGDRPAPEAPKGETPEQPKSPATPAPKAPAATK